MTKEHNYKVNLTWDGNHGNGTANYRSYGREHSIAGEDKEHLISCSSDPSFLGNRNKYNPEELFLSSIASCHMLWYLHLCTVEKIVVTNYVDNPLGIMEENPNGSGQFKHVVLKPEVTIADPEMESKALLLHKKAHDMCFIARSCNFPILCEGKIN